MRVAFIAAAVLLAASGCVGTDYDIEEVATESYLRGSEPHQHDDMHQHDHHDHTGTETTVDAPPGTHVHQAGQRNHGTEWFFNQPWAARFIWSKMARDSAILLFLAAILVCLSRLRRRRWPR